MRSRVWQRLVLVLSAVVLGLAVSAVSAAPAHSPTVRVVKNARYGNILVTPKGMALYYFTVDRPGKSNCFGACAKAWPPFMLPAGMKAPIKPAGLNATLAAIPRGKGRQVTYDSAPLYTFAKDKKPGQVLGEGVGKVWHVVRV